MINLKNIRKLNRRTQSEVAKYLGVTQQTYANYENGKTEAPYDTLVQLAILFNITTDELLEKNTTAIHTQTNTTQNKLAEIQQQQTEQQKNCIDMIMQLDESLLSKAEIYLSGLSARDEVFKLKKPN